MANKMIKLARQVTEDENTSLQFILYSSTPTKATIMDPSYVACPFWAYGEGVTRGAPLRATRGLDASRAVGRGPATCCAAGRDKYRALAGTRARVLQLMDAIMQAQWHAISGNYRCSFPTKLL